jgi:DNA-binding NarL/FixJ family response regulator
MEARSLPRSEIEGAVIRVAIVEPNPLFLEGLVSLFKSEPRFTCDGAWTEPDEAMARLGIVRPDVLLLSLSPWLTRDFALVECLSGLSSGTRALALLDCRCSVCPILGDGPRLHNGRVHFGGEAPPVNCSEILDRLHPHPVLRKQVSFAELRQAVVEVAEGQIFRPKEHHGGQRRISLPNTLSLSPREHEVASLIARGYSNPEIAAELNLSYSTVKNYISSILAKLNLNHRTQIALYALARNGTG